MNKYNEIAKQTNTPKQHISPNSKIQSFGINFSLLDVLDTNIGEKSLMGTFLLSSKTQDIISKEANRVLDIKGIDDSEKPNLVHKLIDGYQTIIRDLAGYWRKLSPNQLIEASLDEFLKFFEFQYTKETNSFNFFEVYCYLNHLLSIEDFSEKSNFKYELVEEKNTSIQEIEYINSPIIPKPFGDEAPQIKIPFNKYLFGVYSLESIVSYLKQEHGLSKNCSSVAIWESTSQLEKYTDGGTYEVAEKVSEATLLMRQKIKDKMLPLSEDIDRDGDTRWYILSLVNNIFDTVGLLENESEVVIQVIKTIRMVQNYYHRHRVSEHIADTYQNFYKSNNKTKSDFIRDNYQVHPESFIDDLDIHFSEDKIVISAYTLKAFNMLYDKNNKELTQANFSVGGTASKTFNVILINASPECLNLYKEHDDNDDILAHESDHLNNYTSRNHIKISGVVDVMLSRFYDELGAHIAGKATKEKTLERLTNPECYSYLEDVVYDEYNGHVYRGVIHGYHASEYQKKYNKAIKRIARLAYNIKALFAYRTEDYKNISEQFLEFITQVDKDGMFDFLTDVATDEFGMSSRQFRKTRKLYPDVPLVTMGLIKQRYPILRNKIIDKDNTKEDKLISTEEIREIVSSDEEIMKLISFME